jgi:hypothetical protein
MRAGTPCWYVRRGRASPLHTPGFFDSATVAAMPLNTLSRGLRLPLLAFALTLAVTLGLAALRPAHGLAGQSLGRLQSQLGAQQSHQQQLDQSIGSLNGLIDRLDAQI